MVLEYILKNNGIDITSDLEIVQNIDFGLTSGAFVGGQGDFTVEFEPHATALEKEGSGYVIAMSRCGQRICSIHCLQC